MESGSADLLDVLWERQEEQLPGGTPCGRDPRLRSPLQDHAYGCVLDQAYEAWASSRVQGLDDSDTEDLLKLLINPNDVYISGSPEASPESDSGISDDPRADTPLQNEPGPPDCPSTIIYEVVCDAGMTEGEPHPFASPLENWIPPVMLPEASTVSELSPNFFEDETMHSTAEISRDQDPFQQLHLPGLYLTDEERRLLSQEGVSLGCNLPLTKAEERILKKVRRKIRNKQSAQDSRRRKKEYIDGLESRVTECSAQNQELQKKVQELETHNVSLLRQLQKLQGLVKQTSTKAAQTSTCLVILLFSLGLLILPSCLSFLEKTQLSQDSYKPSGVISRTILTKGGLSEPEETPSAAELDLPLLQAGGGHEGPDARNQEPEASRDPSVGGERLTNTSSPGPSGNAQPRPQERLPDRAGRPALNADSAKQLHADEM